jgi:hypothetical protein
MNIISKPYSVKSKTIGLGLNMTCENYYIMYEDQIIMILFAPGAARTVCDAMNAAYRVGWFDKEKNDFINEQK